MRQVIVQYKVKEGMGEVNEGLIREVFEELQANRPGGLRYASFRGTDGVSFTHIASIETDDGRNPLAETAAFKAFQAEIRDRCEVPPAATEVQVVGNYGVLGG